MNDDQLESMLRDADQSAGSPAELGVDLADRARIVHNQRRSRRQRIQVTGSLIGCYLAGLLTMWLWFSSTQDSIADTIDKPHDNVNAQVAPPNTDRQISKEKNDDQDVIEERVKPQRADDVQPRRNLEIAVKSPYQLFRDLGDSSHERNDFDTAVSFYKQALDVATKDELEISHENDNFLLMTLKRDRLGDLHQTKQGDAI